jgi:hypothetical protein
MLCLTEEDKMLGKMHPKMADIPEEDLYISIGNCIAVIVVVAAHACDGTVSSENRCLVGNAVAWLVGNVNGIGCDTIPLHAVGLLETLMEDSNGCDPYCNGWPQPIHAAIKGNVLESYCW